MLNRVEADAVKGVLMFVRERVYYRKGYCKRIKLGDGRGDRGGELGGQFILFEEELCA
jgi:hypothetical protein